MSKAYEVNFDGIVGLTHNYSGLSFGNVASLMNKEVPSNPKQAALQGLDKMKYLSDMGIKQGILLPQERPHIPTLKALGFSGNDEHILKAAFKYSKALLHACSSTSSMWAANAATVSPSADSDDRKLHITPANLTSKFHRSIEPAITSKMFNVIFSDTDLFTVHPILPPSNYFTDEGAANHTRFCKEFGGKGVQLFCYGKYGFRDNQVTRFPARQSFEASEAIARLHQLESKQVIFAKQNPKAIDAGVFHNDVISVGHQNVFLYHEEAFANTPEIIAELEQALRAVCRTNLIAIKVPSSRITLEDAVKTYLFNSQIVTLPDASMRLVAPSECQESDNVRQFIDEMIASSTNPINSVKYMNLHQSMRNGGGPACLRLRIVLNEQELNKCNQNFILNDELYKKLVKWVNKHYRDQLLPHDLTDISLLNETRTALDELTKLLKTGPIYDFQR